MTFYDQAYRLGRDVAPVARANRSASCTASWLSRAASCRIFRYSRAATRVLCAWQRVS